MEIKLLFNCKPFTFPAIASGSEYCPYHYVCLLLMETHRFPRPIFSAETVAAVYDPAEQHGGANDDPAVTAEQHGGSIRTFPNVSNQQHRY